MHGGARQEVLQTNGLRDAACQKGEKTRVGFGPRWRPHISFFRHLLKALSECMCVACKEQISPPDTNGRCSSLSQLINSECASDRIFLSE